ncbi:MAG: hypothetical protein HKN88_09575 [Gammaproteobacteria bacterium]|nr:hypothetical protein [Gammaproteobacteria bacterium]
MRTVKYLLILLISLLVFTWPLTADEPVLDYKHPIQITSYYWQIKSEAPDILQIFQNDKVAPLTEYELSGCMFCSGEEDGCDTDGVSSLTLEENPNEPLVMAVCHVGAHSRLLQVFAPLRDNEDAVFSTTGAYTIDYEMTGQGIKVTTDHRNYESDEAGEFTQRTEYWPKASYPDNSRAVYSYEIYDLASNPDTRHLKKLLRSNPHAWDTGEDYLSDTPVGIAIAAGNLGALKLFVEHGYDLNPSEWFSHPVRKISPYTGRAEPEHMQMLEWILSQIERNPDIDYHLQDFVANNHYQGAEILLKHGIDPNIWIQNWKSAWDISDDTQMRNLLESYGGESNFRKVLVVGSLLLLLVGLLLRYLLKPKQTVQAGKASLPERNPKKGKLYTVIGLLILLVGSVGALLTRYGSALGLDRPDGAIIFYIVGLLMAALGIKFISSGRKLQMLYAETLVQNHTGERPLFLYLRSFKLDEEDKQDIVLPGGLSVSINPWESSLSVAFGRVGEMVAIGRPGEKLATTGASRLYVTDDEWQDKVLELIDKTDLVIWTFGDTKGLRWEISRLVQVVPPEKLIIAMPFYDKKMSVRKEIWQGAQAMLNETLEKPLPGEVGESLFIAFDQDWNAHWVKTDPPSVGSRIASMGFWNRATRGVRSLLKSRGYAYPELLLGEKIAYGFLAALGWILVGTVLVMLYGFIQSFF